jgi:hypothetical protein
MKKAIFFIINKYGILIEGKKKREKGSGGERKKCDSCKQTQKCWLAKERKRRR